MRNSDMKYSIFFGLVCIIGISFATSCTKNSDCNNGSCNEGLCVCTEGYVC